jgi:hypothetical protein
MCNNRMSILSPTPSGLDLAALRGEFWTQANKSLRDCVLGFAVLPGALVSTLLLSLRLHREAVPHGR